MRNRRLQFQFFHLYRSVVSSRARRFGPLLYLPVEVIHVTFGSLRETVLRSRFAIGSILWNDPFLCNVMLARSRVRIHLFSKTSIVDSINMQLLHPVSAVAKLAHAVIILSNCLLTDSCLHLGIVVVKRARHLSVFSSLAWMVSEPWPCTSAKRFGKTSGVCCRR